jgi:hypothetical protein
MQQPSPYLPFDPTRQTQPTMMIDINNPPMVPPYQCEPEVAPYLRVASGLLMNEIQNGYQSRKPLRIFAANQYMDNGFVNQDFYELFAAFIDYAVLSLHQKRFARVDEALVNLCPIVVNMAVADNMRQYPMLKEYVDQALYGEIVNTIHQMDRVKADIRNLRIQVPVFGYGIQQRQQQPVYQTGPQGGRGQFSRALGVQSDTFTTPFNQTSRLTRQQGGNPFASAETAENPYSNMLARTRGVTPVKQVEQEPDITDVLKQPFSPRQQVSTSNQSLVAIEQNPVILENDGSLLVPERQSTYTWKPSEKQPYRPLYSPSTEARYHRVFSDGSVVVEVHPKEGSVDFEKHNQVNTIFGKPKQDAIYDSQKLTNSLAAGVRELADRLDWETQADQLGDTDEGRAAREQADEEPTIIVVDKDSWKIAISPAELYIGTAVKRAAYAMSHPFPDVYRTHAYLCDPVLCADDQSDFLRRLSESRTYLELSEKLAAGVNESDLGLVEVVTRRAIVMLNRVLALYLSIRPDELSLKLDFDTETIRELEQALQEDYGDVVFHAYRQHQRKHIASIFQAITKDEESRLLEENLRGALLDPNDFKEGETPWMGLLTSVCTVTLINAYAQELGIDLDPYTGSLITEDKKELHSVIENLFDRLPKDVRFNQHLLLTNDSVVLEVVQGDIGENAYLLSASPSLWLG